MTGLGPTHEASVPPETPSAAEEGKGALPAVCTVAEAAKYLRVNPKTIYSEIAAGRIRVIRLGRAVRIPRGALEALCAGK